MADLITPSKYHRTIDGEELFKLRGSMSQQQLADSVGVSRQFIQRLESPGDNGDWLHEITADLANRITKALCN